MRRAPLRFTLALLAAIGPGAAAPTQPAPTQPAAMRLGAASNFSQGSSEPAARAVFDLPVHRLRDSIRWAEVERTAGRYTFDKPITTWPDRFAGGDVAITLTLNGGNPLYDDGDTPHSPRALAAFGRFAAAVVRRFPRIDTLEIGNEVNSANFVSGPVKQAGLARRGAYHLALVRAAAAAVKGVRPNVRVLGGSTHSVPGGFLWPLLDLPGAQAIEGLALHPYTTPIDQLPAQFALLRRHAATAARPIHVTEFGSADPDRAADDLVRGYATLAALGTTEMDWYPLNERGDGLVPLVRRDGTRTAAGKAFAFVQSRLGGLPARDVSPDRFTFVRAFGPNIRVVWGAPRPVAIDAGKVTAFGATGDRLAPSALALREDRVLVLVGSTSLERSGPVRFGCNPLVADSFYQFGYPRPGTRRAVGDGFLRLVRVGGHELPFEVMPGQQRTGVPWTPYLGRADMPDLRLMADSLLPAVKGPQGAVVHRFIADRDRRLRVLADFAPSARSRDGIAVTMAQGGRDLLARRGTGPIAFDTRIAIRKGERLDFAVEPGGDARGDTTRYRIRLFDEAACS